MKIFNSAKIKLTSWYLLILTFITLSFSVFVYSNVVKMTDRALEAQRQRMERRVNEFMLRMPMDDKFPPFMDTQTIREVKERTLMLLVAVNLVILGASGILSYLLAGITLKPIEVMLNKQKRFVSDAAHELKTPLTAVKAELEVTLRDKGLDLASSKKAISGAILEIDKLNLFVNNLLKQSKYQIQGDKYQKEPVVIRDVIKSSLEDLKHMLATEKANVVFRDDGIAQYSVMGDAFALKEVFSNIIENAVKYSKESKNIQISQKLVNNDVVIEIKDNGIGISENEIEKIFDPFYRTDSSRSKNIKDGFGLGLSISKEIVENHGGTIKVQSEQGKGSTFRVILPTCRNSDSGVSQSR